MASPAAHPKATMQFSDLGLPPSVVQAVGEAGYSEPTPIQAAAIPAIFEGRDLVGIAQTGTGKTAAFTLPMISILARGRARARMPRSLILCPTRELAAQVADNFKSYGRNERLNMALLIGGVPFEEQNIRISRGADVVIATPGRLLDHFGRGHILLTGVQIAVLDEADRMLDMGFIPDIERIFRLLPFTRQTLLFSATMPPEIARLADEFLHTPRTVEAAPPATTVENVHQAVIAAPRARFGDEHKRVQTLARTLRQEGDAVVNALVFCNRKRTVSGVARLLQRDGFDIAALHGDLDQRVRMATLDKFRSGETRILIASDVAARGLDLPMVSHVFNFDVPHAAEDYVHRIGRTARAGRSGTAITLYDPSESNYLARIEKLVGQSLRPVATTPDAAVEAEPAADPETRPAQDGPQGRRPRRPRRGSKPATAATRESATRAQCADQPAPEQEPARPRRQRRGPRAERRAPDPEAPLGIGSNPPRFLLQKPPGSGTGSGPPD